MGMSYEKSEVRVPANGLLFSPFLFYFAKLRHKANYSLWFNYDCS